MPYFITDSAADCAGWATIKDDGEVIGCHTTKQDAVDQMIAVSISEDIEPGGERVLPDNYRPALAADVPQGRACGNCYFYDENNLQEANGEIKAWCEKWDDYVRGDHYCNAWAPDEESDDDMDDLLRADPDALNVGDFVSWNTSGGRARGRIDRIVRDGSINVPNSSFSITGTPDDPAALITVFRETDDGFEGTDVKVGHKFSTLTKINDLRSIENRQVNLAPPAYMRAAARRGLQLNAEGLGGDGLVDRTIREARSMADGQVSEDKWRRIAPWIARHMVDLDAPSNANPDDPGYPGAGLVAHLLWGSGPSKSSATRAMNYAQSIIDQLDKEEQNSRWSSIAIQLDKDKEDKSMTPKVERRIKTDVDFEIRLEPDTKDGMRFTGYAAVFDSNSEPLPFIERIVPGAFKRSLKARNEIKMFVNHNMDMVLASTRAKTLRLTEDSKGLLAEAELPDTSYGRDLSVLMKRGDVHAMSFGFSVPKKGDRWSEDGTTRELLDIRLHEVSIVTGFPAYEATTASVRTLEKVASRTKTDPDKLADALLKLESGETLNAENAELITEVVTKLRDDKPLLGSFNNLDIKRKQLDLVYKAI